MYFRFCGQIVIWNHSDKISHDWNAFLNDFEDRYMNDIFNSMLSVSVGEAYECNLVWIPPLYFIAVHLFNLPE